MTSFREPLKWNETRHTMNVPYEVLTKCCDFVADPISKMAASGVTLFNIGPYGKLNAYKSLLLESLTILNEIKHSINVPFLMRWWPSVVTL